MHCYGWPLCVVPDSYIGLLGRATPTSVTCIGDRYTHAQDLHRYRLTLLSCTSRAHLASINGCRQAGWPYTAARMSAVLPCTTTHTPVNHAKIEHMNTGQDFPRSGEHHIYARYTWPLAKTPYDMSHLPSVYICMHNQTAQQYGATKETTENRKAIQVSSMCACLWLIQVCVYTIVCLSDSNRSKEKESDTDRQHRYPIQTLSFLYTHRVFLSIGIRLLHNLMVTCCMHIQSTYHYTELYC